MKGDEMEFFILFDYDGMPQNIGSDTEDMHSGSM